jgi:hypothetical protein
MLALEAKPLQQIVRAAQRPDERRDNNDCQKPGLE